MEREIIEADVLCVGGGPAALMAAIHASEQGAEVVVADKGNTLRSGAAATGNDHISCYIPEKHGDLEPILRARLGHGLGRHKNQLRALFEQALPVVTYPEECWHCNACVLDCPTEAIRLRIPMPAMLLYKN